MHVHVMGSAKLLQGFPTTTQVNLMPTALTSPHCALVLLNLHVQKTMAFQPVSAFLEIHPLRVQEHSQARRWEARSDVVPLLHLL